MTLPPCCLWALRYARRGWAVFPLNGKAPYRGTRGHLDATTDRKQIRRWWKKWPDANVAIRCDSENGPIVGDVDGPSGEQLLKMLPIPETRVARSRPGRRHLYFDAPLDGEVIPRTIRVKKDGIKYELDILGDGGYVIAPPSIHPETGKPYEWLSHSTIVPFPVSLIELIHAKKSPNGSAPPLPAIIHEGERDNLLTSLAGSMRRRGASEEAILAALQEENRTRVNPPLTDKDLRRIARSIARKPPAGAGEHLTDLGNARRFIAQYADRVRHCAALRNPWLVWDGTRWAPDETGEVVRMSKNVVRSLYAEAAHVADEEVRDKLLKHAAKSESAQRIKALAELAATEEEISLVADQLDADPWLFNVENGTLDLRTGELRPHRKEDLLTKLAPVEYRPNARCERWLRLLKEVTNKDKDLQDYLQRIAGYALTGSTKEQCFFFAFGRGGNGKGTFLNTLRKLLGEYAQQADFNTFLARRGEGPRNDLARLRSARFVVASESQGEKSFDAQVMKQVTGNDTIVARMLYQEHFEYTPQFKIFLSANHKPRVDENTHAFWRRIRLIPFTRVFEGEQMEDRDKLDATLAREMSGILRWALEGCMRWQKEGLHEAKAVRKATESYRDESDPLAEFFAQRCIMADDAWTSGPDLYQAFVNWWAATRGQSGYKPMPPHAFHRSLGERAELTSTKRNHVRGWRGIAVKLEVS